MLRTLPLAVLLLLSGCKDLVSVCYSCIDSNPYFPVAEGEIAEIELMPSQRPLPKSARNVFYAEE